MGVHRECSDFVSILWHNGLIGSSCRGICMHLPKVMIRRTGSGPWLTTTWKGFGNSSSNPTTPALLEAPASSVKPRKMRSRKSAHPCHCAVAFVALIMFSPCRHFKQFYEADRERYVDVQPTTRPDAVQVWDLTGSMPDLWNSTRGD